MEYKIEMTAGICWLCKKEKWLAENGACFDCIGKRFENTYYEKEGA